MQKGPASGLGGRKGWGVVGVGMLIAVLAFWFLNTPDPAEAAIIAAVLLGLLRLKTIAERRR